MDLYDSHRAATLANSLFKTPEPTPRSRRSFYPALEAGEPLLVPRNGAAMLWLFDNPRVSGLFNMGSGEARSFAELIGALFSALGREPRIEYIDTPEEIRANYQYFTRAEMGRLRAAGYGAPFRSLDNQSERIPARFYKKPGKDS